MPNVMEAFYYVYILISEANNELHYSGITRDLKARLIDTIEESAPTHRNTGRGELKLQSHSDLKLKLAVLNAF